mmetsp:Transcript_24225/g.84112  ORF Transcript_24225/g.84112 Transcript_24225/m.84112 type:complete len:380 (+) Transcript_24225:389-1528(+)
MDRAGHRARRVGIDRRRDQQHADGVRASAPVRPERAAHVGDGLPLRRPQPLLRPALVPGPACRVRAVHHPRRRRLAYGAGEVRAAGDVRHGGGVRCVPRRESHHLQARLRGWRALLAGGRRHHRRGHLEARRDRPGRRAAVRLHRGAAREHRPAARGRRHRAALVRAGRHPRGLPDGVGEQHYRRVGWRLLRHHLHGPRHLLPLHARAPHVRLALLADDAAQLRDGERHRGHVVLPRARRAAPGAAAAGADVDEVGLHVVARHAHVDRARHDAARAAAARAQAQRPLPQLQLRAVGHLLHRGVRLRLRRQVRGQVRRHRRRHHGQRFRHVGQVGVRRRQTHVQRRRRHLRHVRDRHLARRVPVWRRRRLCVVGDGRRAV